MIIVSVYFLLEQLAEIGFEGAFYVLCATAFTQEFVKHSNTYKYSPVRFQPSLSKYEKSDQPAEDPTAKKKLMWACQK